MEKQGTKLRHNGHYASYVALFLGIEVKGKPHLDKKWLKKDKGGGMMMA